jgi:hypothetical protein
LVLDIRGAFGYIACMGVHYSAFVKDFRGAIAPMMRGPDECWLWDRSCHAGYATFRLKGRLIGAHRAAFEAFVGEIPDGMSVCHKCDTPRCINPAHLFLGTQADNLRDMFAKGRHGNPLFIANRQKTHCVHGHAFTPENTYVRPEGRGMRRQCKQCVRGRRRH